MVNNFSYLIKFKLALKQVTLLILLAQYQIFLAASSAENTEQPCKSCHEQQFANWHKSDHSKAMALADDKSVLGNFVDQQIEHFGQKANFFRYQSMFS